jgi:hypothetical protein
MNSFHNVTKNIATGTAKNVPTIPYMRPMRNMKISINTGFIFALAFIMNMKNKNAPR